MTHHTTPHHTTPHHTTSLLLGGVSLVLLLMLWVPASARPEEAYAGLARAPVPHRRVDAPSTSRTSEYTCAPASADAAASVARCCPTCPVTDCSLVAPGCCANWYFEFVCHQYDPTSGICTHGSCSDLCE